MTNTRELNPKLLEILICPISKDKLQYDKTNQTLISKKAGLAYPIHNGIPILLKDEAIKITNTK